MRWFMLLFWVGFVVLLLLLANTSSCAGGGGLKWRLDNVEHSFSWSSGE